VKAPISIELLNQIDIRVGTILAVSDVPNPSSSLRGSKEG
jgi:tRNA-binding EMAP/Myf-like protein